MPQKFIAAPAPGQIETKDAAPNRRPGRTVASNGYVLIRVGTDHPMADVRGYAYEHRLVMSQKIGRSLDRTEIVHHKNEIKTDNRPENLQLVSSIAEHQVLHRTRLGRRLPGETNPEIPCACGCGATLFKYDSSNRPRTFVSGHNPQPSPALDEIYSLISSNGPLSPAEIRKMTGRGKFSVQSAIASLSESGRIVRVRRGLWKTQGEING